MPPVGICGNRESRRLKNMGVWRAVRGLIRVLISATASIALSSTVGAQVRGGMPAGIPAGIPMGIPGRIPTGPSVAFPGNIPSVPHRPVDVPANGPPDSIRDGTEHGAQGLERAREARSEPLSQPQKDRAAHRARELPNDYELDRNGALVVRGEVLATGLDASELERIERAGFSILRRTELPDIGITLVTLSRGGMAATEAIGSLRRIAPKGNFALNHVLFESRSPGAASAPEGFARTGSTRPMVTVGLIDTGVGPDVGAGAKVQVVRRNFAPSESRPAVHGTAVASVLARGAGQVKIYAADIFGSGPRGGTSELLLFALAWMASARVPVINVSMVGPANQLVRTVVERLTKRGFTIVAPVGNDGSGAQLLYPASYPGVVAVSATDANGRLLAEASRVRRVDFVAPGITTVRDLRGHETVLRGTSFAAPVIARLIADQVEVPDPATARGALSALAKSAFHPTADRQWYGQGILGISARCAACR